MITRKSIYQKKIETVEKLIEKVDLQSAMMHLGTIVEILLKDMYLKIISKLSSKEKIKLIESEEKILKGKTVEKANIGHMIALFSKEKLLRKYERLFDVKLEVTKTDLFQQIIEIRNKCTHTSYQPEHLDVNYFFVSLKKVLQELYLLEDSKDEKYNAQQERDMIENVFELKRHIQFNNLPTPEYTRFIGRENYKKLVIKYLQNPRYSIVTIDGIGGVGKTALALEIAQYCWENKLFEAVIWNTAKKERMGIFGIEQISPTLHSLESLYNTILKVLGFEREIDLKFSKKEELIIELLSKINCLIIIDNLEAIEDNEINEFLFNLPIPSKALITSRERLGQVERVIQLPPFNKEESKEFISIELQNKGLPIKAETIITNLYRITGGIPLALKLAIGWISDGFPIEKLETKFKGKESDILLFCFYEAYNRLDFHTKKLFAIFSILPDKISYKQIREITGIKEEILTRSLNRLVKLSMLSTENVETDFGVETLYSMLPLTRNYALDQLASFKGLEIEIRKRMAKYYKLSDKRQEAYKQYGLALIDIGGQSPKGRTAAILANLAFATAQKGDYSESIKLFKQAIETDKKLSYPYQLWATVERQRGNLAKAEQLLSRALELNPRNWTIWSTLAMIKRDSGDLVGAKETLLKGIEQEPDAKMLQQQLSVVLSQLGHYSDSIKTAEKNIEKNPTERNDRWYNTMFVTCLLETFWKMSENAKSKGDYSNAENIIERAVEKISLYSDIVDSGNQKYQYKIKKIYRQCGIIKRFLKKYTEAVKMFKKALFESVETSNQHKHNCKIYLELAKTYKYSNRQEEMRKIAEIGISKCRNTKFLDFLDKAKIVL